MVTPDTFPAAASGSSSPRLPSAASAGASPATAVRDDLLALADPARAQNLTRYFQVRPDGYGAGDRFLGIGVPGVRAVAHRHAGGSDDDAEAAVRDLLASPWHEERLAGLLVLVRRYRLASAATASRRDGEAACRARRERLARLYLQVKDGIDNWDLVDLSVHEVLGAWLHEADSLDGVAAPALRAELGSSSRLWDRRIAMISTFASIRAGRFDPTLTVAEQLLHDPHDLIHKAVGWMLREVGNRDRAVEEAFLRVHATRMPRTALRYAIEKFPPELRQAYLRA